MINSMMDGHQHITVAVAFDERSGPLVGVAADLCRRAGKKLHLLHVVEPWPAPVALAAMGASADERARRTAERHLEELASSTGLPTKTTVVVGKPAERLGKEAATAGSCLLVVGCDTRTPHRAAPRGYATALSLLATAPVPVLALDPAVTPRLPARGLGVFLADDLSPQSEAALGFASDLAAASGEGAMLHHFFANALTLDAVRMGCERTAAADAVFDGLVEDFRAELGRRAAPWRDYLEAAGGGYAASVRTGAVTRELPAAVLADRPDVLVFGRHATAHAQPFFLGRAPYGAMLAGTHPVIVVPAS